MADSKQNVVPATPAGPPSDDLKSKIKGRIDRFIKRPVEAFNDLKKKN